ncbi:MAG: HAMP domain-containing histidine kinase [Candidatus Cloacimonetes bacterium]|nr:HAMP domain-containing histidine kinase [Candidatus Cloacimonadota bacterium]MCF7815284.1 HAMP domain-containing histidine kinase [Candidatus Cloacimonadota bacterium]MCF7869417.1 HAMP domain-containing histidine kinase [Candidatus Cloacimonadota bacterium]MCF7884811.1 HAMP domain-containing histidine kinase [Candidatus Cloacimonadota bacterium]
MKVKISLRALVITLFLVLYLSSLIFINAFFIQKHRESGEAFQSLQFDESLSQLAFQTKTDSLQAKELLRKFNSSRAASEMIRHEAQIYSTGFLFVLMLISVTTFIIVFYVITKPLKEMQSATVKIRKGDFGVKLPVTGFKELKDLKISFNRMSEELETTQKKLIRAEKESIWKELSRILAHEIKNPLTPIQLTVQRLEEKFEFDKNKFDSIFSESIKIINQEIENLQKLAYSFSSFAKNIEPDFSIFNLKHALKEILQSYTHRFDIEFICPEKLTIEFDRTHFYQIITNILQNAIDASPENPEIEIKVAQNEENLEISINDNGVGISEEHVNKIFEPYYTKKKKGTGLGLALVKKLIDINEAEIEVNSKLNVGTEFIITIKERGKDESIDN